MVDGHQCERLTTPSVSLPTATGFTHESDRSVWTQNGFKVTVMGNADVITRDGTILPQKTAAPLAETLNTDLPLGVQEETSDLLQTQQMIATTLPTWTYTASQIAAELSVVPDMDLISPTFVMDDNKSMETLTVAAPSLMSTSNTVLFPEDELLYAWLMEEQYQTNRKKQSELFDDIDNWLEDFEELALRELRK